MKSTKLEDTWHRCWQLCVDGSICGKLATHYINDDKNQAVCEHCLQDLINEENNRSNRTR